MTDREIRELDLLHAFGRRQLPTLKARCAAVRGGETDAGKMMEKLDSPGAFAFVDAGDAEVIP